MELQKQTEIPAGKMMNLATRCLIGKDRPRYSLYIKQCEQSPVYLDYEGIVEETFRGRLYLPVYNHTNETVVLTPGTCVGYLILCPYIQPVPTSDI